MPTVLVRTVCASLALSLGIAGASYAQPQAPEDWPCIQSLVPEVAPATLWARPLDADREARWRDDAELAGLAQRLGTLDALGDQEIAAIQALVDATPGPQRGARLDTLAFATVELTNERRSRFIDGIRRYTQQQIAIAGQIETSLNELARLDEGSAPGLSAERSDAQETLAWHERLYDQREGALRALCEQPVVLEETLSSVVRELQARLPES